MAACRSARHSSASATSTTTPTPNPSTPALALPSHSDKVCVTSSLAREETDQSQIINATTNDPPATGLSREEAAVVENLRLIDLIALLQTEKLEFDLFMIYQLLILRKNWIFLLKIFYIRVSW